MENLHDLKTKWSLLQTRETGRLFDEKTLHDMIKQSMKQENNAIMKYFWSSFTLNMMVYALSFHVIIRFWSNATIVGLAIASIAATLPFTYFLLIRYKAMATSMATRGSSQAIHEYILRQRTTLIRFFNFKRKYEWFLIPVNAAVGVLLVFTIFVPGGVSTYPLGVIITFLITLVSCVLAIREENTKRFIKPLDELQAILDEFDAIPKK